MRVCKRTARKCLAEGVKVIIRDNKGNHAGTVWPKILESSSPQGIDAVLEQAKDAGWGSKFTFHIHE